MENSFLYIWIYPSSSFIRDKYISEPNPPAKLLINLESDIFTLAPYIKIAPPLLMAIQFSKVTLKIVDVINKEVWISIAPPFYENPFLNRQLVI